MISNIGPPMMKESGEDPVQNVYCMVALVSLASFLVGHSPWTNFFRNSGGLRMQSTTVLRPILAVQDVDVGC